MPDINRFNESVPELILLIEKRRGAWRLQYPEWDDVKQIILTRLWNKFDQYDETRPLENWANVVITRAMINLLRDNIYKAARPCISADVYGNPCAFNTGADGCSWTPSKVQCEECPLYAKWRRKKETQLNLMNPVSLENHLDESYSMPVDDFDVVKAEKKIHEEILKQLNPWETKLYKYLYIQHLSVKQTLKKLKVNEESQKRVSIQITKARKKFIILAKEVISRIDL